MMCRLTLTSHTHTARLLFVAAIDKPRGNSIGFVQTSFMLIVVDEQKSAASRRIHFLAGWQTSSDNTPETAENDPAIGFGQNKKQKAYNY